MFEKLYVLVLLPNLSAMKKLKDAKFTVPVLPAGGGGCSADDRIASDIVSRKRNSRGDQDSPICLQ